MSNDNEIEPDAWMYTTSMGDLKIADSKVYDHNDAKPLYSAETIHSEFEHFKDYLYSNLHKLQDSENSEVTAELIKRFEQVEEVFSE